MLPPPPLQCHFPIDVAHTTSIIVPTLSIPAAYAVPLIIGGVFAALALLELWRPAHAASRQRWWPNLALGIGNSVLLRLLAIAGPLAAAHWAATQGLGLFAVLQFGGWLAIVVSIILLDMALYWQHRAMHRFAWGWALHRLHHADTAFDVSTGVRFNPAEALVSMLYKSAIVIALGLPAAAVLAFEAWIAVFSLFEHSNIALPRRIDGRLQRVWVTPAMHRVHHSAHGEDHNHNYGFAIGLWDHLFGTYQRAATGPKIGLPITSQAG